MKLSVPSLFMPGKGGWTKESVVRAVLAITVIVGGTVLGLSLIGSIWYSFTGERMYGSNDSYDSISYEGGYDTYSDSIDYMMRSDSYYGGVAMSEPAVSNSYTAYNWYEPYGPYNDGGADAEAFERTSYTAFFDTSLFSQMCSAIAELKSLDYVVFSYATESDSWCSYEFKVEHDKALVVADAIRALEPTEFLADTATVAGTIDEQEAIRAYWERRLTTTQSTRSQAEDAYEALLKKAVSNGNVSELTNVVVSSLATTERLTREIQEIEEQLERLDSAQANTQEETLYEHFSVQVQKRVYVDWYMLGQQWRDMVRDFAERINEAVLMLTFGFVSFVLRALVFVVFVSAIILGMVVIAKYMLIAVRYVWKKL